MAFSFGAATTASGGLFGSKSTATVAPFGAPAATASTGFSLAKTTASSAFSFGAPTASTGGGLFGATAAKAPTTGLFGATAATTATSGLFGTTAPTTATTGLFGSTATAPATGLFGSTATAPATGLFGATAPATTGLFGATAATGSSLFGAAKTTATSGLFGTTTAATSGGLFGSAGGFKLGGTTTATTGLTFGGTTAVAPTAATTAAAKPLENPKEEIVPAELAALVSGLEKHITSQQGIRDELSKISSKEVTKCSEEISSLKQVITLVASGIQRDSVVVSNLKNEVSQELRNAEVAHRAREMLAAGSTALDFLAPLEYFERLVRSFECRIGAYRQEIDELETFLSTSSPMHEFSPQDLSNVLKGMNESFLGLASHLQTVHEAIKNLKQQYLTYRRVVYNDNSDPFAKKKTEASRNLIGPSPFPPMQGAPIAQNNTQTASALAAAGKPLSGFASSTLPGISTSFFKPAAGQGMFRSLSAGGSSSSALNKPALGGGLFGSTSSFATPPDTQSTLQLQKPPKGKTRRF